MNVIRAALLIFSAVLSSGVHAGEKLASPAVPSAERWNSQRIFSTFVIASDGTRLAVTVTLPEQYAGAGATPSRFPVIFRYTPYLRTPRVEPSVATEKVETFVQNGYAIVAADMRGTGASEGWMNQMSDVLREDGKEIIDWIAAQPWSNGRVGMTGGSYVGWAQLAVASKRPAALKAIVPTNPGWDGFKSHPGGILSYAFMQTWSALTFHLNRGTSLPGVPLIPAAPVVDEDGDGSLLDEVPMDLDGDGWFHDDYAWPLSLGATPKYADGGARTQHYYLSAIMQHHAHPQGAPGTYDGFSQAVAGKFRDSRRPGDGLRSPDLNWGWVPQIRDSGVAILFRAGWFDPYVRSVFELHSTLASSNPTSLIVAPEYHNGVSPAFAQRMGYGGQDPMSDTLRWMDHWLKGIDNGVDRDAGLRFFVMNDGWRTARQWPLPSQTSVRFYLDRSQRLSRTSGTSAGQDRYRADFSHGSGWEPAFDTAEIDKVNAQIPREKVVSRTFLRNRQLMYGVPEGPPLRTQLDRKAQTYTSAPLREDTDVIGHPLVRLWASSTADDGDFFFYLEDVAPNGEAVLVTEYQHRAGFSRLRDNNSMIPNNRGLEVLPKLPWHGFDEADYDPKVFANGRVAEIHTSFYPTAWRFRKGHSIRLSIAAADWPAFELHPALAPSNRPDAPENILPVLSLHRGGQQASYVELPIVPREAH